MSKTPLHILLDKVDYREEILDGQLPLPQQIVDLIGEEFYEPMSKMFSALWYNFLSSMSSVSVPYYSDKFGRSRKDVRAFVDFTRHLAKAGWTVNTVIPNRNWGEIVLDSKKILKYVSSEELHSVRLEFKARKYMPKLERAKHNNRTKVDGKIIDSGIVREGFRKAGNSEYKFDVEAIKANKEAIAKNLTKSMDKLGLKYEVFKDSLSYREVSLLILDYIIAHPNEIHTTGANINDSRGRGISQVMKQVFNPISNKDARACVIICNPKKITESNIDYAYHFIGEALGYKTGTVDGRLAYGKEAYANRTYLELDLSDEHDRKDLHINIWLKRLYAELDRREAMTPVQKKNFKCPVPIESDSSASMLSYIGALTNHAPFLEMTNCMIHNRIVDPWKQTDMDRDLFKKAMTPLLYGSSESCQNLWAHRNLKFTKDDIKKFNKELTSGQMAVAKEFKNFIIQNVNPQEEMIVTINDEEFLIRCNRYKQQGEYICEYHCYDSNSGLVQTIRHTHTKKVADLKAFALYFVTLLVHNLDSQVMNYCCEKVCDNRGFSIPIHDAMIHDIADAILLRTSYAEKFNTIYTNRNVILSKYFKSIGIDKTALAKWNKVAQKVIEPTEQFVCGMNALK